MSTFFPLLVETTVTDTTMPTETATTVAETVEKITSRIDISKYDDILNPSVWSTASLEGIIIMILIVFIIYKLFHRAYKFAWWCIGAIFMIEILYLLGLSDVNNYIPLHDIFKYDIGTSIAQLFVGTKISSGILYVNEMLNYSIIHAANFFAKVFSKAWVIIRDALLQSKPML